MIAQYVECLPICRDVARQHGYAIGFHGSGQRDLDLIAVPWIETVSPVNVLVGAICNAVDGYIVSYAEVEDGDEVRKNPVHRPHGRLAWSIHIGALSDNLYIDISVFSPNKNEPQTKKRCCGV